jgi:hypothetical protein
MDRTLEKDSSSLFLLTQLHTDHQERAEREKAKQQEITVQRL